MTTIESRRHEGQSTRTWRRRLRLLRVGLAAVAGLLMFADTSAAQSVTGDLFAGVGSLNCCDGHAAAVEVGGGAEFGVSSSVSIGATFGLVGPLFNGLIKTPANSYSLGTDFLFTLDGQYHVRRRRRKWEPFVAGGIGVAFRSTEADDGLNVGGGVDVWIRERRGLRVEVRDQLLSTTNLLLFRVGLLLR